jgi:hypothetical protein
MKKTYALIENEKVVNVILWDGQSEIYNSDDLIEVTNNAGIGWDYVDGKFTDNRPEPTEPE